MLLITVEREREKEVPPKSVCISLQKRRQYYKRNLVLKKYKLNLDILMELAIHLTD
jgi:hypothetical protein